MTNNEHPEEHTTEQTPLLVDGPADDSHHLESSNLIRFRNAIGINVQSASSNPHELENARRKPSGLYREIIGIQRSRTRQYYIFEYFYYGALIVQILIGAILAALGSLSNVHPTVITTFGVLNTAIAGILALMKGQGLPDRLRKDAYEMKKVQDFIEETDIRLAIEEDVHPGELNDIVQKVFDMYNTARDTAEMNHPTNYAHQVDGPENTGRGTTQSVGHDGTEDDSMGIKSVNRMATNVTTGSKGKTKFVIE
ncbi:uncharacterized protein LY89DRAFT_623511 [Mollisia scopiformis]|uniref:SMODS and SLOG-associating 2TM effector domain-containing protein n=1 Tax=Mollisia scopiformis TaxID=149040 RepID=A0A194WWK4_MOLSC|nr:uncharacterized protein LY89DRAFT_623511 [Mollisia scopiformis]KUJ12356.1 hypothetical protein LY89DRAFT_623511 [Mollisia scopiformis]